MSDHTKAPTDAVAGDVWTTSNPGFPIVVVLCRDFGSVVAIGAGGTSRGITSRFYTSEIGGYRELMLVAFVGTSEDVVKLIRRDVWFGRASSGEKVPR